MRGAKRRLGGLAGNAGLLAVIGLASVSAGGAGATSAPQVFALTIRATTFANIDHTDAPAASGGCTTMSRAKGLLTIRFATRRPVLVRFAGGRLQPVTVAPLDGTAVLTGSNALTETCAAGQQTVSTEPCPRSTRRFRGARTTLDGTHSGAIAVGPVGITLRPIDCPREPDELRRAYLAPTPGPLRVTLRPRSTQLTLRATAARTKSYGSPESGILTQRTIWKFMFARRH